MNISVKTLTGKTSWSFKNVSPDDTVMGLKQLIQGREGIEPEKQRLAFNGSALANDKRLSDCGVKDGSVIRIVLIGISRP